MSNTSKLNQISYQPRLLWFLILSYSMMLIFANWFDARLIQIFGINTDAGTLVFPLTFLLSDLLTEVYGFKQARLAIWTGFLFNGLFLAYGELVTHLPSPDFATNNHIFDQIISINARIAIASALSYSISEPLNSMILAKMKIRTKGQYMSLRFIVSTIIASGIDSLCFANFAFYGTMPIPALITLIFTMWIIKVGTEFIGLPISINLAKKIKKLEQIDIYDEQTSFNLFSLDTEYQVEQNHYQRQDNGVN